MRLTEEFFARPSMDVARDLVGRHLVRHVGDRRYVAMITETGAYEGGTRRKLQCAPGDIYVAIFRGGYETLCIGTDAEGKASVATIRKAYPIEGTDANLLGSGRLARALHINKGELEDTSINGPTLYIEGDAIDLSRILTVSPTMEKMAENCLGYYRIS